MPTVSVVENHKLTVAAFPSICNWATMKLMSRLDSINHVTTFIFILFLFSFSSKPCIQLLQQFWICKRLLQPGRTHTYLCTIVLDDSCQKINDSICLAWNVTHCYKTNEIGESFISTEIFLRQSCTANITKYQTPGQKNQSMYQFSCNISHPAHIKNFNIGWFWITYTHTQPFKGLWSRTTRVGRYQKKHSPTHTHPDHRTSIYHDP